MSGEKVLELVRPASFPKSFVERIGHRGGPALHMVRTYDQWEKPCWFLLRANERSLVQLEYTSYDDMIDLTRFGEVVDSGWGHEPEGQLLKKLSASGA